MLLLQARVDLQIYQSSNPRASPSYGLMSYPEHSLVGTGSYIFAQMQLVYSTTPADWAVLSFNLTLPCAINSLPESGFLPYRLRLYNTLTASLQRVRPPRNECPGYDTKESDSEVPVNLELWGMWSAPSLPFLPGPHWPRVVAPYKGPIYGLNRTKLWFMTLLFFLFKLHTYAK